MRCPIFSTVSRFGHFSKSCLSSPGSSCCSGGGMRYSRRGGSRRRQRRQLPTRVRYCTSPHTLQRMTSRSNSASIVPLLTVCSDTGPRRLFRHADRGNSILRRGKAEAGAPPILPWGRDVVKWFCENFFDSVQNETSGDRERLRTSAVSSKPRQGCGNFRNRLTRAADRRGRPRRGRAPANP